VGDPPLKVPHTEQGPLERKLQPWPTEDDDPEGDEADRPPEGPLP
jgi:hypothetical protein